MAFAPFALFGSSAVRGSRAANPGLWLLLLLACEAPRDAEPDAQREPRGDTSRAAPQVAWTVRPILNAPRYFVLRDWVTNDTLWGVAGENPVDLHAVSGAAHAWGIRASGAHRSPDGSALAWADTTGIWIMHRGGRARRVLRFSSLPVRPAGDPTFDVRWAPNGRRLLTSWAEEGSVTYALVDTISGGFEPLALRLPGYGPPAVALWLDDRRILFTARATGAKDGTTGYRESGWRADIAVHDLGTHELKSVTSVPDGVFLEPVAAWGDTILALRRSVGDTLATFSLFDTRSWAETASAALPRGTGIAVSRDGGRVAVFRSDDALSQVLIRSRQPGTPSAAPILVPGRITGAGWSPNGSLAVSTMAEEPIQGRPGDLRAVYRLLVVTAP